MPTPAERKALIFLASVIALGATVRVVRAARDDGSATTETRQALARQLAAVDSARSDERAGSKGRSPGKGKAKRRQPKAVHRPSADTSTARILELAREAATGGAREATLSSGRSRGAARDTSSFAVVDLDVADLTAIEALPRIGPVLAQRIVDDRALNGAFGSLQGFERVRGVGPALASSLRTRVTFSGTVRPSNAVVDSRLRSSSPLSKSPRRERRN